MKKNVPWCGVLLCFTSLILALVSFSCDQLPEILDDPLVSAEDLEGTWIKTFDTPVEYDEGLETDAVIISFSGSEYEMIFYYLTEQNGGVRGSYGISEAAITLTVSESWDDNTYWDSDTGEYSAEYNPAGQNLAANIGYPDAESVEFSPIVFTIPDELADVWKNEESANYAIEMPLDPDGTYSYYEDQGDSLYEEGGTWDATDELLRAVTTTRNDTDVSIGFLHPYSLGPLPDGDPHAAYGADLKLDITVYEEGDGGPEESTQEYWNWQGIPQ